MDSQKVGKQLVFTNTNKVLELQKCSHDLLFVWIFIK